MKHVFVQRLVGIFTPHREENVASNELVNNFAVSWEAIENDSLVIVKLDHHMFCLPIDVPGLKDRIMVASTILEEDVKLL